MTLKAIVAPVYISSESEDPVNGTGPQRLVATAFAGVFKNGTPLRDNNGNDIVFYPTTRLLPTDGPLPLPPLVTDPRPRIVADLLSKIQTQTGEMGAVTVVWLDRGLA